MQAFYSGTQHIMNSNNYHLTYLWHDFEKSARWNYTLFLFCHQLRGYKCLTWSCGNFIKMWITNGNHCKDYWKFPLLIFVMDKWLVKCDIMTDFTKSGHINRLCLQVNLFMWQFKYQYLIVENGIKQQLISFAAILNCMTMPQVARNSVIQTGVHPHQQ